MFDWLFGSSRNQDRLDKIIDKMHEPYWPRDYDLDPLPSPKPSPDHEARIKELERQMELAMLAIVRLQAQADAPPAPHTSAHESAPTTEEQT